MQPTSANDWTKYLGGTLLKIAFSYLTCYLIDIQAHSIQILKNEKQDFKFRSVCD